MTSKNLDPSLRPGALARIDLEPSTRDRARELLMEGPDLQSWTRILHRILLFAGAALSLSGILCFFAFNWQKIPRFGKFGMVIAGLIAVLAIAWKIGVERLSGKVALSAACFLVGVWLAVFGQIYQTGADPFELFRAWAFLILPWVLLGRFQALWGFWFLLLNLWTGLAWEQAGSENIPELFWKFFALNGVAWLLWEVAPRFFPWAAGRAMPRSLSLPALGGILQCALLAIVAPKNTNAEWLAIPALILVMGLVLWVYLKIRRDLFMVTVALACIITALTTALAKALFEGHSGCSGALFLGLCLVAQLGGAAAWLRVLHREAR